MNSQCKSQGYNISCYEELKLRFKKSSTSTFHSEGCTVNSKSLYQKISNIQRKTKKEKPQKGKARVRRVSGRDAADDWLREGR